MLDGGEKQSGVHRKGRTVLPRDGLLQWSGHLGKDQKDTRVAQSKHISVCKGPGQTHYMAYFVKQQGETHVAGAEKVRGLFSSSRQSEEWGGPDHVGCQVL